MYLLLLVSMACATLVSGVDLQCFNDYDKTMDCHFSLEKSDCSEYSMDLKTPDKNENYSCIFKEGKRTNDNVTCSCTISMELLIIGEDLSAKLSNGKIRSSKTISVKDSIKPKRPRITEVEPSGNGNFRVTWKTNYNDSKKTFADELITELTYRKKGDIEGVSQNIPSLYHEILGTYLESNTEYVLSIRTRTVLSSHFSDISEEWHFTTPVGTKFSIVIGVLCLIAGILTCALFWCFLRLKTMWWAIIPKYPKHDLLKMVSRDPWVLTPSQTPSCPISVEGSKMNETEGKQLPKSDKSDKDEEFCGGTDHDSSSQSYAITCPLSAENQIKEIRAALSKVFFNLSAIPVDHPDPTTRYKNITNSIPVHHQESMFANTPLLTMNPLLPCDSGYNSNERSVICPQIVIGTGQQDPTLSLFEADLSYQQRGNGSESSSSAKNNSPTCDASEPDVPTVACSLPPTAGDYQALRSPQQHNSPERTLDQCTDQDGLLNMCQDSKRLRSSPETMPHGFMCNSQVDLFFPNVSPFINNSHNQVVQIDEYHCA